MVNYKVNLKFKDTDKSLNEIISEALKIELQKKIDLTCNMLKNDNDTHYFLDKWSSNWWQGKVVLKWAFI